MSSSAEMAFFDCVKKQRKKPAPQRELCTCKDCSSDQTALMTAGCALPVTLPAADKARMLAL
jgi:hypothetical protein